MIPKADEVLKIQREGFQQFSEAMLARAKEFEKDQS
jgi:hypothetical protein